MFGAVGVCWLSLAGGALAQERPVRVAAPDDPLFAHQWNLHAIQIPSAWAVSRGAGATVAVLDTGVAYEDRGPYRRAPDLASTRLAPGWDFVDGDAHPNDVAPRGHRRSHGTLMAAIIAGTAGNRIGGAGVAPAATIMPIRVLGPDVTGSPSAVARGLRFAADHRADVASVSISGHERSRAVTAAIRYATSRGTTIVAAAGNDGAATVSHPAADPSVIAVGAMSRDGHRARYSNFGAALDLVAPGGAGNGIDVGYGPPDGVAAQTLRGGPGDFCICFSASTSAAAAHVSGVAALLVGSGRARTPVRVRAALVSSARDLGPPGRDPEHGAGLVQARSALAAARAPAAGRATPRRPASGPSRTVWWVLAFGALACASGLALAWRRRRGNRDGPSPAI